MEMSGSRPPASRLGTSPGISLRGLWKRRAIQFKILVNSLVHRPRGESQASSGITVPSLGKSDYFDSRSHLQQCCERALDAHTVEDAIFWHSEIINELSVEIYTIGARPWPDAMKERALADLTELQSRHGAILHRLTGIVARNEQLVWEPQPVQRK
jgi:hypothetical protein